jgi:5'-deoxynucleotidase YfbR-like HD superfamily hydrolase
MANEFGDILTPQGYLNEVMQQPNLDVVMNLFKIPRAFAVSGFGDWNVGQHCFCVAYLALYWAKHRRYDSARRDRLMVMGLTHDLHESATGDILPGLKTPDLRRHLEQVQESFLKGLGLESDAEYSADLKVLDMAAFLFEIRQCATANQAQRLRLSEFFHKQKGLLVDYCVEQRIDGVEAFLTEIGLDDPEGG